MSIRLWFSDDNEPIQKPFPPDKRRQRKLHKILERSVLHVSSGQLQNVSRASVFQLADRTHMLPEGVQQILIDGEPEAQKRPSRAVPTRWTEATKK